MSKRLKSTHESQSGVETETLGSDVNAAEEEQEEEDRISDLPDSILCHILQKIPTKCAVGTAILSTRWKHLFSQIPNLILDIDDSQFLHPRREFDSDLVNHRRDANFIGFMYNLLTVKLRDVPRIRELSLRLSQDYGNHHLNAWISAVLRLNVSQLCLLFHRVKNVGISTGSLFCCTTLEDLLLSQHYFLNVPSSVSFPNLKFLCLFYVTFLNGDTLERVIAACPMLNGLSLVKCKFEDFVNILRISSPSIKNVALDMLSNCHHDGTYDLMLDMPTLESLRYVGHVPESYHIKNLSAIGKAHIDAMPSREQLENKEVEDVLRYMQNVRDLVGACSNVSSLYLSRASMGHELFTCVVHSDLHMSEKVYIAVHLTSTLKAIFCSVSSMPIFHNLTELELGYIGRPGWELLPHLLEIAPNLEVLVFMGGFSEYNGCFAKFRSLIPERVPTCLTSHLLKIIFGEFKGEENELDLVEYFLKHAEVLRMIGFIVSVSLTSEKLVNIRSKLLDLQKCSSNCQMDLQWTIAGVI